MPAQTYALDKPVLIGFIGRAGCGKSTAASWFVNNHKQVLRMSFAAALKAMTYELIREAAPKQLQPIPSYYVNDGKEEPIPFLGGVTGRRLMQTLGTDWGRNTIHPDLWVGIAATKLEARLQSQWGRGADTHLRAVFDDVRFQNEADFIHAAGGIIVRIERPEEGRPAAVYEHASEQQPLIPDMTIRNAGTTEDFFATLATTWPPTAPQKT
jgi:hypothetical protein